MAYTITNACVNCGACCDNCPVGAIKPEGHKHAIDKDVCIECGSCLGICPVDAIEG